MHRTNAIHIQAPAEAVFNVAADLMGWTAILPHYRFIRKIGVGVRGDIVVMSARRSGIPLTWTSEYWSDPRTQELHFIHQRQWTRGMYVVWKLTPTRSGTRVEIIHDLKFRLPWLAWLAEPVIGGFFISNIAGKTLHCMKLHIEQIAKTPNTADRR
jgi:hypothetical protein